MKRIIAALLIMAALAGHARISDRQIEQIVSRLDVADTVMHAPSHAQFWQLLQMSNKPYRKAVKSLRGRGDRDIKHRLIQTLADSHAYFAQVPVRDKTYEGCERMIEASGLRQVNPLATLTITDEADISIFGYPNGYLFMTGALYDALEGDSLALQSLLAAEEAHYALQHAYAHAKAEKSRAKRHRFFKILGATALAASSIVADQATDGAFPAELGITAAVMIGVSDTPQRHRLEYTPEQIVEADIVAYRFMQLDGNGRAYIDALRRVGHDLDVTAGYGKDYLTVTNRIAILEYLDSGRRPRKIKANKAGLRPVPAHTDIFAPSNYR